MVEHGLSGIKPEMPELRGYDEVNIVTAGNNRGECPPEGDLILRIGPVSR